MKNMEQMEEKPEKAPTLRIVTGGRGGGTTNVNWLMSLPEETVFLCKDKEATGIVCFAYQVVMRLRKAVLLREALGEGSTYFWFDSMAFSQRMEFVELVKDMFNNKEEEQPDG